MNNPLDIIQKYAESIPVPVYSILDDLGLGPVFQFMEDNISGWIERRADGTYEVAVNFNHGSARQRFTAAHELGHFIYHRDLLGRGTGDTRAYRADGTPFANREIRPVHERQANTFAANLLMPKNAIQRLRAMGVTAPEQLADRLQVSKHAMCIRLGVPY